MPHRLSRRREPIRFGLVVLAELDERAAQVDRAPVSCRVRSQRAVSLSIGDVKNAHNDVNNACDCRRRVGERSGACSAIVLAPRLLVRPPGGFMVRARTFLAAALAIAGAATAWASHPHRGIDQLHISTIHDNSVSSTGPGHDDEEYCIQSHTSTVSSSAFARFVEKVLTGYPGHMWDGAANHRVDLWRTANFCDAYDAARRRYIEIEYLVQDRWPNVPLCGDTQFSCTTLEDPRWDPTGGHTHYRKSVIHFQARHVSALDDRARSFVNHETGHALGLRDPEFPGDCADSVMHNQFYNCAYNNAPTASDLASVLNIALRRN